MRAAYEVGCVGVLVSQDEVLGQGSASWEFATAAHHADPARGETLGFHGPVPCRLTTVHEDDNLLVGFEPQLLLDLQENSHGCGTPDQTGSLSRDLTLKRTVLTSTKGPERMPCKLVQANNASQYST